jgi:hypothetical protein
MESKYKDINDRRGITESEDAIFYLIYDEHTGGCKGLLELSKITGETKLHKQWCEITMKNYEN